MPSDKQIEANRANATKSTGPRSQQGKAQSRLNSWKHGLSAKTLLMIGEKTREFDKLRSSLMNEHDPQSVFECQLVERLAVTLWRLRRVPNFEVAILDACQQQVWNRPSIVPKPEGQEEELDEGRAIMEKSVDLGLALMNRDCSDTLAKIGRYETSLMNAVTKTLQMLYLLQYNRANDHDRPDNKDTVPKLEVLRLPKKPE